MVNGKNKSEKNIQQLLDKRTQLVQSTPEVVATENLIAEQIWEKNRSIIIEQISEMTDETCNLSRVKMWKVKQKVCPRNEVTPPVAKMDKSGNLISNQDELKSLYVNTYKDRLKHRNMKPSFSYLKELKDFLFEERVELSKLRKSPFWTEDDLWKVQKSLGLINELFKPGVAGCDVIKSLLLMSNKAKDECDISDFLQLTNITSIYKHRGSKSDLNNDRGIFNVSAVRSVIDKLVYNDIYEMVDRNMSDSNVGGRRGRNNRDNLFIINGVINYALKENIDIDINL